MTPATLGLGSAVALGIAASANAGDLCESIVYCDDFDTYEANENLIGQDCDVGTDCQGAGCPDGCRWEAWDGLAEHGDAIVVDSTRKSEPHSVEIDGPDHLVHTYKCYPFDTGVYQYTADLFIPEDYEGDTHFILLNTYTGDGNDDSKNRSTQVHFDSNRDQVISDSGVQRDGVQIHDDGHRPVDEQNEVGFVRGEWKQIRVVMDFDEGSGDDGQDIYYADRLVIRKSWVDWVSGGGQSSLEALGLFANGATPVFYDNIQICKLSPLCACCFADANGTCTDAEDPVECTHAGGVFQGFGSSCDGQCPRLGEDGWILDAPFVWDDRQGRNDSCDNQAGVCEDVYEGEDLQFDVTIPWTSTWTLSTDGSELLDTEMLIGTGGICTSDLVDDDGCVPGPDCDGSQDESGPQAVFTLRLAEGDTIYVDLEDFSGECGESRLAVQAPCPDITLPEGDEEGETCGERENDGCNMDPGQEAFTPIDVGQTILGKSWLLIDRIRPQERDTDWYVLTLGEDEVPIDLTISVYGELGGTGVAGFVEYNEDREGSGDCAEITGFVSPFGAWNRCSDYPAQGELQMSREITVAGTYWLFVGPVFGGASFDCDDDPGGDYYLTLEVTEPECTPAPDGDVDRDGCTDFDDVLLVLANWDSDGSNGGDADCDGDVDFDDLLIVLAGFDEEC